MPSDKLKNEIKKLTGNNLETILITDSAIRHIRDEHAQNQAAQKQVDITPEDIALVPFAFSILQRYF
jgi:vacuolar-type H+-ATPase subunit F/Vma7